MEKTIIQNQFDRALDEFNKIKYAKAYNGKKDDYFSSKGRLEYWKQELINETKKLEIESKKNLFQKK